jgi:hypothetical protein
MSPASAEAWAAARMPAGGGLEEPKTLRTAPGAHPTAAGPTSPPLSRVLPGHRRHYRISANGAISFTQVTTTGCVADPRVENGAFGSELCIQRANGGYKSRTVRLLPIGVTGVKEIAP